MRDEEKERKRKETVEWETQLAKDNGEIFIWV